MAPRDSDRKMSKVVVQHRSDMLMQEQVITARNEVGARLRFYRRL